MQYSQEGNKFNTMPIQPHDQGLLIKMVFYSIHVMYYHKNSIIQSANIHLTVFKLILIVTYLKSHLFFWGGGVVLVMFCIVLLSHFIIMRKSTVWETQIKRKYTIIQLCSQVLQIPTVAGYIRRNIRNWPLTEWQGLASVQIMFCINIKTFILD